MKTGEQKTQADVAIATEKTVTPPEIKKKLWYCKQCGYVVFREDPPHVCPICKAKRELFAEIKIHLGMAR